jgi:hypothetical protein
MNQQKLKLEKVEMRKAGVGITSMLFAGRGDCCCSVLLRCPQVVDDNNYQQDILDCPTREGEY